MHIKCQVCAKPGWCTVSKHNTDGQLTELSSGETDVYQGSHTPMGLLVWIKISTLKERCTAVKSIQKEHKVDIQCTDRFPETQVNIEDEKQAQEVARGYRAGCHEGSRPPRAAAPQQHQLPKEWGRPDADESWASRSPQAWRSQLRPPAENCCSHPDMVSSGLTAPPTAEGKSQDSCCWTTDLRPPCYICPCAFFILEAVQLQNTLT